MRIGLTTVGAIVALVVGGAAHAATVPQLKITAGDGASGDRFGSSVALLGNIGVVGAPGTDGVTAGGAASVDNGAAYLFDVRTGGQIAKLTAGDGAARDALGSAVALSDAVAVVGAVNAGENGAAYLFDVATGGQVAKLTASDGEAFDGFGGSVGVSGGTAIVGASGDDDGGFNSGAAYLFDVATGGQLFKLTASDASDTPSRALFGGAVAMSGTTAIVGAQGAGGTGAAYLFDTTTGAQLAKLTADDGDSRDLFGGAVAIAGNFAVVGAAGDDDNGSGSGSAYLFDITTGAQLAKFTGRNALDLFGSAVALADDLIVIGARGVDGVDSSNIGAAYVYSLASGGFIKTLMAGEAGALDDFGTSVAVSGGKFLIGSNGDDALGGDAGAVYVAPIPLPASAWLLLGAFGGLAAMRRRNRRVPA